MALRKQERGRREIRRGEIIEIREIREECGVLYDPLFGFK